jgi:hypothetical protein
MSDEDIAGALRSWAEHVSAGYVVPAAGGVMVTVADRIEALAAENARLIDCFVRLRAFNGGVTEEEAMQATGLSADDLWHRVDAVIKNFNRAQFFPETKR